MCQMQDSVRKVGSMTIIRSAEASATAFSDSLLGALAGGSVSVAFSNILNRFELLGMFNMCRMQDSVKQVGSMTIIRSAEASATAFSNSLLGALTGGSVSVAISNILNRFESLGMFNVCQM